MAIVSKWQAALSRNLSSKRSSDTPCEMKVGLLTGGFDRPYAFGLAMVLVSKGICLEVIGSDEVDSPEMHTTPGLRFLNLWRCHQADAPLVGKAWIALTYYARLIRYTAVAKPGIFH